MRKIILLIILIVLFFKGAVPVFAQSCSTQAPSGLSPNGKIAAGTQSVVWNTLPNTTYYKFRIHDNSTGTWTGSFCPGVSGTEVCVDTTLNYYNYNFIAGHTYLIWVHGLNSCNVVGDPAIANVTVENPPPLLISPSNPTTYYVSTGGNDNNPGTESQPFKTIQKAKNTIRNINQNMTKDIAVYLRGGYYQLDSPLTFDSSDSGTNGFNIFYLNYPGEVPLISGGKHITGWEKEGNKWKAKVGNLQTRQLYVNGQRATRARSIGGLPGAQKTTTGFTTTDLNMQNWGNKEDVEFVANNWWKQFRCGVQNITGNTITMKQPCWTNSQLHKGDYGDFSMGNPAWIENAYDLLDQQGEWYFNKTTGWIYYMPRPNEDMTKATVVAPVLETLISGTGSLDNPIHNIVFSGLTFAYATWLRPGGNDGHAQIQADYTITGYGKSIYDIPWGVNWTKNNANIVFHKANNIQFTKNNFLHLGAVGLSFEYGSQNNLIFANHFTDISASAINIGDTNQPKTTDQREITAGNKIFNNYVHNVAVEFQGSVGIWLGYVQNSQISRNELSDLPYTAISIGWGWGANDPSVAQNNQITNNYIHDHVNYLFDGGGIYSLSAQPGNLITGNLITDQPHQYGAIYLDDGSRFITVNNNVLYSNARNFMIKGSDHNISDNYETSSAPSSIINNAGIESAYQNIKNLPAFPNPTSAPSFADIQTFLLNFTNIFDFNRLISEFGK